MSECFVRMIQNSIIVSIIFLVLQCIRPMLKGIRYSTFRMVWIILILFLLLPVEFKIPELTYEMEIETKIEESLIQYSSLPQLENTQNNLFMEDASSVNQLEIQPESSSSIMEISLMDVISAGTLLVGIVLFVFQMFGYIWFHRLLKLSASPVGNTKVPLMKSDLVDSPLLTGLFHPIIVLPTVILNHPHLDVMILHELTHYQSKDLMVKFMMMAARCLHWFNPIVYLFENQCSKDLEMACDERVLQGKNDEQRQIYANTLLDMACKQRFSKAAFTTQFSTEDFKQRISALFEKTRKKSFMLSMIVLAIMGLSISLFHVELQPLADSELSKNGETTIHQVVDKQIYQDVSMDDFEAEFWVEIEEKTYALDFKEDSLQIMDSSNHIAVITDQNQIQEFKEMVDLSKENQGSNDENQTETKQESLYQDDKIEKLFHDKKYDKRLYEVRQIPGELVFEFDEHSVQMTGVQVLAEYSYYDGLMQLYYQGNTAMYEVNNQLRRAEFLIAISFTDINKPYIDGKVISQEGDEYPITFDLKTLEITDNEEGSATLGKPMKFADGLDYELKKEFVLAWNQAVLQYQILRFWHEELEMAEEKDNLGIRSAEELQLDVSLLKQEPVNTVYKSQDLKVQAISLTKQFLMRYQYHENFKGFKSSEVTSEHVVWDMAYVKNWLNNGNHPYYDLIELDEDGYYLLYFDKLTQYAYELYGLEFIPVEYTEVISTKEDHYLTGFETGFEAFGPYFELYEIRAEQDGQRIVVSYDLWTYSYDEQGNQTKDEYFSDGSTLFEIKNENGKTFLRHVETIIYE